MNIAGAVTYDPIGSTNRTSNGPNDVKSLTAPKGTDAMALSVESPAIRVTFDGKNPSAKHGLRLVGADHFFAIGKSFKFASAEQGHSATINVVWLRARLLPHAPSS
ncbi:MAG TPA: hypothetical protein VEG40_01485 [Gaiellaceae bacterium]|nr:hypothetical protein [Gaiellaceae bacterium]